MFKFFKRNKEFLLCKDCYYCKRPFASDSKCKHKKSNYRIDPVTGEYYFLDCKAMRIPFGKCGQRAKLFVKR